MEKMRGSRGRAHDQGVREAKPPEDKTLLTFGRAMEAAICLLFNIWKCKKLTNICVFLQK